VLRVGLFIVLIAFLAQAFWRLVDGVLDGMRGGPAPPARRVSMERDPVCGTFVVPERAITLTDGRQVLHFCSTRCRDAYRARIA
jgi:hypothetical protein